MFSESGIYMIKYNSRCYTSPKILQRNQRSGKQATERFTQCLHFPAFFPLTRTIILFIDNLHFSIVYFSSPWKSVSNKVMIFLTAKMCNINSSITKTFFKIHIRLNIKAHSSFPQKVKLILSELSST